MLVAAQGGAGQLGAGLMCFAGERGLGTAASATVCTHGWLVACPGSMRPTLQRWFAAPVATCKP